MLVYVRVVVKTDSCNKSTSQVFNISANGPDRALLDVALRQVSQSGRMSVA